MDGPLARADRRAGIRFAAPAVIILTLLLIVPSIQSLLYSFFNVPASGDGLGEFVGLENYQTILGSETFWRSMKTTFIFSIGFVSLSTIMGLLIATLLDQEFVGRGFARGLLVVSWATPWLILGIVWRWYSDGSIGGLNALLTQAGILSDYHDWLTDPRTALPLTIVAAVWRQASFSAILFLAGLQTLPASLHEAAQIDGAGSLQRYVHITLAWLRPVMITVIVLNIIYAFLQFDVVFAMTQGGPGDATQVLSMLIYRQLFVATNFGLGSALAVLLGAIALLGGLLTVRILYRKA